MTDRVLNPFHASSVFISVLKRLHMVLGSVTK